MEGYVLLLVESIPDLVLFSRFSLVCSSFALVGVFELGGGLERVCTSLEYESHSNRGCSLTLVCRYYIEYVCFLVSGAIDNLILLIFGCSHAIDWFTFEL